MPGTKRCLSTIVGKENNLHGNKQQLYLHNLFKLRVPGYRIGSEEYKKRFLSYSIKLPMELYLLF